MTQNTVVRRKEGVYVKLVRTRLRDKFANRIYLQSDEFLELGDALTMQPVELLPYCAQHQRYQHCCETNAFVFNIYRLDDLPFEWNEGFLGLRSE
jgi:hypothetical protein